MLRREPVLPGVGTCARAQVDVCNGHAQLLRGGRSRRFAPTHACTRTYMHAWACQVKHMLTSQSGLPLCDVRVRVHVHVHDDSWRCLGRWLHRRPQGQYMQWRVIARGRRRRSMACWFANPVGN